MHFSGRGRESSSTRDSGAECAPSFTIRKYATNKKYFSMVCSFINFRKDLPNIPTTKISTAGGGAPGCVAQSLGLQKIKKKTGYYFIQKDKRLEFSQSNLFKSRFFVIYIAFPFELRSCKHTFTFCDFLYCDIFYYEYNKKYLSCHCHCHIIQNNPLVTQALFIHSLRKNPF